MPWNALRRISWFAIVILWLLALGAMWSSRRSAAWNAGALVVGIYLIGWGCIFVLSRGGAREAMPKFWLASVSVAITLLLIELPALLGVIDYRDVLGNADAGTDAEHLPRGWFDSRNRLDRELLYVHKPHQKLAGTYVGGDLARLSSGSRQRYAWDVTYDANGFRNPSDLSRADVAVIGDSFVEGVVIPEAQLLTSLVARETGRTVVNLGQLGYGPQQELAVLRRFALPLSPKTVVWVFFEGNDLTDVWRYRHAYENWDRIQFENQLFRRRSFARNALFKLDQLLYGSEQARDSVLPERLRRGMLPRPGGREPVEMCFGWASRPLGRRDEQALEVVSDVLREAFELCEQSETRLVVAFAPETFRVYGGLCRFDDASPFRRARPNDLPERLREITRQISYSIPFVDLTPDLVQAAECGALVYFPDDTHWTPEGHAVAARAIARHLDDTHAVGRIEPSPVSSN